MANRLQIESTARSVLKRHKTLGATLDWSYSLLSSGESELLRCLSIFKDSFSLGLAFAVAGEVRNDRWDLADQLGKLIDRSLVEVTNSDPPRYYLLQTTRTFAIDRLNEAGDAGHTKTRFADAIVGLLERATEEIWRMPHDIWIAAYAPEINNVRSVMRWAANEDVAVAIVLKARSTVLMHRLSLFEESRRWGSTLDEQVLATLSPKIRAEYWLARCQDATGVLNDQAQRFALMAANIYQELGDAAGMYVALSKSIQTIETPPSQNILTTIDRLEQSDWPPLLRREGARAWMWAFDCNGNKAKARETQETVLALSQSANSNFEISFDTMVLADLSLSLGDANHAIELGQGLLSIPERVGGRTLLFALGNLANAYLINNEQQLARELIVKLFTASRLYKWELFGSHADVYALLAAQEGRLIAAARLLGFADRCYLLIGERQTNEARARSLVWDIISGQLTSQLITRQMDIGALMTEQNVSELTLLTGDLPA